LPAGGNAYLTDEWIAVTLSVIAALPFAFGGQDDHHGGNPAFRIVPLLTNARISQLAPVLQTTPAALMGALQQQGYQVASADQTIEQVAATSKADPQHILFQIMPQP
jgi:hypothetical protein